MFCNLTKEEQRIWVSLEIMRFDDIIILDCSENMNEGKTYTYFSSLPKLLEGSRNPPYHYVMKADDDIYIRFDRFVESLRPLPRDDLYYGFVIPCVSNDTFSNHYMAGMGYLVSWDIVEWISESDIPKNHLVGPEDMVFGEWLRRGRKGKNRFNTKWWMYDYPEPHTVCVHELWNDTIAVHRLKTEKMWINTLRYLNVTDHLKPSKFYHVPLLID